MRNLRLTGLLLKPSVSSLILCLGLAGTILGISAIAYATKNGLLYNYIFGPNSSSELIETSRSSLGAMNQTVFGNPLLNKILFFGFWMTIGLIVYLSLSGVWTSISSAYETVNKISYATSHKMRIDGDLKYRILLRIVAGLLLFIYSVFFFRFFLPFSTLAGKIGAGTLDQLSGWFYGFLSVLVLSISLHIYVVLARFLMLRPRLIGGWDEILESELKR